jgi:hypothetical protein
VVLPALEELVAAGDAPAAGRSRRQFAERLLFGT